MPYPRLELVEELVVLDLAVVEVVGLLSVLLD